MINHELVTGYGGANGIPIHNYKIVEHTSNTFLEITTLYRHNLSEGDVIKLKNGVIPPENEDTFLVHNVGDLRGDDLEYKFLINVDKYTTLLNRTLNNSRVCKVINKKDSEYYLRNFKLLNIDSVEEMSDLSLAVNVYGDPITQIQYIDDIIVDGITNSLGKPIEEIFLTLFKNQNDDFTELNWGVEMCFGANSNFNIRQVNNTKGEHINVNNESFLGDIVEYNEQTNKEVIIEPIQYRFNTTQRENRATLRYLNDEYLYGVVGENKFIKEEDITFKEGYYYKAHHKIQLYEYDDNGNMDKNKNIFINGSILIEDNLNLYIKRQNPFGEVDYDDNNKVSIIKDNYDNVITDKIIEEKYTKIENEC